MAVTPTAGGCFDLFDAAAAISSGHALQTREITMKFAMAAALIVLVMSIQMAPPAEAGLDDILYCLSNPWHCD